MRTRVSKFTYGSFCAIPYDPSAPDHRSRSKNVFTAVSGTKRITGSFNIILPKVSCLILFFRSTNYFFTLFIWRIPKFRRRRNSGKVFALLQILQLFSELLIFLYGVTVEMSRPPNGKILIPVRRSVVKAFLGFG